MSTHAAAAAAAAQVLLIYLTWRLLQLTGGVTAYRHKPLVYAQYFARSASVTQLVLRLATSFFIRYENTTDTVLRLCMQLSATVKQSVFLVVLLVVGLSWYHIVIVTAVIETSPLLCLRLSVCLSVSGFQVKNWHAEINIARNTSVPIFNSKGQRSRSPDVKNIPNVMHISRQCLRASSYRSHQCSA